MNVLNAVLVGLILGKLYAIAPVGDWSWWHVLVPLWLNLVLHFNSIYKIFKDTYKK